MQLTRPVCAADPRRFGQRIRPRPVGAGAGEGTAAGDLRLFSATFAAGFLFVFLMIV